MNKSVLRSEYLKKRMDLTQDEIILKNNAILENLNLVLSGKEIETIHFFCLSMEKLKLIHGRSFRFSKVLS